MSYASEVLQDHPVAYWRLGEAAGTTAADVAGSALNGTYINGPALGQPSLPRYPNVDTSVSFDGVNQYVDATGTAATLSANGRTTYTVECWIKTTANPGAGVNQFFVCKPKSAFYAYALYLDGNVPGKAVVGFGMAPNTALLFPGATTINDGLPHYLVAVRNPTGGTLYVDGRVDGVSASAAAIEDNDNFSVRIGALGPEFTGIEGYVAATIDEVALYTTALSAERIQAHYYAWTATIDAQAQPRTKFRVALRQY